MKIKIFLLIIAFVVIVGFAQAENTGNTFFSYNMGYNNSQILDDMNHTDSYRFTAINSNNLTNIFIFFYSSQNTTFYDVGIMADNDTNALAPRPSGTWLANGTIMSPTHNKWGNISVSPEISLSVGTAYWIVVRGHNNTIGQYNETEWEALDSKVGYAPNWFGTTHPYNSSNPDISTNDSKIVRAYSPSGDYTGTDWLYNYNDAKIHMLKYNDSTFSGQPNSHAYMGVGYSNVSVGRNKIREIFNFTQAYNISQVVGSCGDLWDGNNPNSTENLHYSIYAMSSPSTILASGVLNTSDEMLAYWNANGLSANGRWRWCQKPLTSNITFAANTQYALEISCPNCSGGRTYTLEAPEIRDVTDQRFANITYGGQRSFAQTYVNDSTTSYIWAWYNTSYRRDYPSYFIAVTTDTGTLPSTPAIPIITGSVVGKYFVLTNWADGGGNVTTDSYNVSVNGTWYNGTTDTFFNNTGLLNFAWSNVTIWAWNNTGNGNLSNTSVSLNTQLLLYSISGYVTDSFGVAISDVLVTSSDNTNTTNASGYYILSELIEDTYLLTFYKSGYENGSLSIIISGANATNQDTILSLSIIILTSWSDLEDHVSTDWSTWSAIMALAVLISVISIVVYTLNSGIDIDTFHLLVTTGIVLAILIVVFTIIPVIGYNLDTIFDDMVR